MNVQSAYATPAAAYCPQVGSAQATSSQPADNAAYASADAGSDQVSISSAGRSLSSLTSFFSQDLDGDGKLTLDELRQFFQENSADFQKEVKRRLAGLGVDASQPLKLTTDAGGNVRVAGDHPDKEKIEAMFADDPELANQFRQISATGSLIKACEAHVAFAADYAQNPEAAVAKHAALFSSLQASYLVSLDDNGVSMVKAA